MLRDHTSQEETKERYSTANSDCNIRTTSSGHDSLILYLSENDRSEEPSQSLVTETEQMLPSFQTVKRHYSQAVDSRTYCLTIHSTRYDKTVSNYISKRVKKVKSKIKAHFFNTSSPIFIIGFLATFNFASDTNHIHQGEVMRILPFCVESAPDTTLNSRMSAAAHIAPVVAMVNMFEPTT